MPQNIVDGMNYLSRNERQCATIAFSIVNISKQMNKFTPWANNEECTNNANHEKISQMIYNYVSLAML